MNKPKVKMESVDFVLFSTVMLLVSIGVVMVYSASSYIAYFNPNIHDSTYYLKRQFLWAVIGIVFMIIMANVDYHIYKRYTKILMLITVALLLVVFASHPVNGARRWIDLGFTSLQPSEIAKYIVVLYLAKSIENKGEKIKSLGYGVIPYILVAGFYAGLVLAEKNLSIASVIMIVTFIVLFVAGAQMKHLFTVLLPIGALGVVFTIFEPYRMKRLMNFRNPWLDSQKEGYQLVQSLLALGSGGIWGVGLGKSRQKCFYIPEPHNDFIFAIIGEELGLIGCVFIIALFIIFIWRGIQISSKARDTYGMILAIGITSVIAVQAVINIAVVTGSMPVTGVPLPFISSGGSSLVINLIAMGILLNISRQSKRA